LRPAFLNFSALFEENYAYFVEGNNHKLEFRI